MSDGERWRKAAKSSHKCAQNLQRESRSCLPATVHVIIHEHPIISRFVYIVQLVNPLTLTTTTMAITKSQSDPSTPSRRLKRKEATTTKRTRFFTIWDEKPEGEKAKNGDQIECYIHRGEPANNRCS